MKRLFAEHQLRSTQSLDGFWDFAIEKPKWTERMYVPGCWNTKPRYFDWHGKAYYRRTIHVPTRCNLLLTFEGVSGAARVMFDGREIGRSPLSFLPVRLLVPNTAAGAHELLVELNTDKKLEEVFPQYGCDWFHYGGIIRPVEAAFLGDVWVKELRMHYSIAAGRVRLEPAVTISNLSQHDRREVVRLELNGEVIVEWPVLLRAGQTRVIRRTLAARRLGLWSPDEPRLHLVRVVCGGDDLADRTGFRSITKRKGRLRLNGRPLKLLGVNRHHEYGDNGFAIPHDIVQRDFEIIREMGCNAMRCHYPIDALAMDFADELGLLFWQDLPMYARSARFVGDLKYLALAEAALTELVRRDFNRPSVFVWGVMNECATDDPIGVRVAARLAKKARALDATRFVSYATNKMANERAFAHFDIAGLNSYPGWYDNKEFLAWPEAIPSVRSKLRKEGLSNMPIVVTETGAAGLYGDRSLEDRKWSEGFQERLLEQHLTYLLQNPDVSGVFIWQFADVRTIREYWVNRPGTFNNKGLLDRFRRPKDAYWTVREIYQRQGKRNWPRPGASRLSQ